MPSVSLKHKYETFESLLRRWKKAVDKSDILKTLREKEFYERPGEKRKRAKAAAIKRQQRLQQELDYQRLGIKPPRQKKDDDRKKKYNREEQND